ncbi:MAG: response regulator [Alphaproteobacteria bacterium]|nr:response regulator [Alphaproteobacteria bacterium]
MARDCAHILVIDDDTRVRGLLQRYLQENGFAVTSAKDAENARMFLQQYKFDMLIVDVMMPNESGLEFLQKLRKTNDVPAIVLTAMGETQDRICGLEAGADDYLPKPFEPKELVLRINNILRRVAEDKKDLQILQLGDYCFDMSSKEFKHKIEGIVHITPAEQAILSILGQKTGQIFTRERLSEMLGSGQSPRSIDVQITRLRKKIEPDSKNPRYLQTVRGKGYMLLTEEE